jgi:hemoglobin/transferrin/lactoferrin receptor protein
MPTKLMTTSDDAGGFISALTPSGNRSLWGAYVQDEISYNSWLRVLGALREDGYNTGAAKELRNVHRNESLQGHQRQRR